MWIVTGLGWALVLAGMLWLRPGIGAWLGMLFFAVPTIFLARDVEFPKRRLGLMSSWVGPALIVLTLVDLRAGMIYARTAGSFHAFRYFVYVYLGGEVLLGTAFMAWYTCIGLLPVFSIVASLGSQGVRERAEALARTWPPRRWWIFPLIFLSIWSIFLVAIVVLAGNAASQLGSPLR